VVHIQSMRFFSLKNRFNSVSDVTESDNRGDLMKIHQLIVVVVVVVV
jgi:hypothetical protein